ncbi:MAG TPA: hypothetical protein VN875_21515 [Candidatus Binatus sp.]|nr:hypothetical protein [Candidatus Binatus sp.]
MAAHEERSWFWKKIGFWFVPVKAGTLGPEEWAKVRKMSRTGKRRTRRLLFALLWVPVLACEIAVSLRVVRLDPWAGLMSTAWLAALLGLWVRSLGIGFAQVSLEDRALMEYRAEFDVLKEKQRGDLFQRAVRDGLFGRVKVDEHEAEMRLRAQGAAYRLLGPALLVFLMGYWAVCLLGPFGATRTAVAVTAVVVTWLVALVLAAPTMIRMWTQPDEMEETASVAE